MAKTSTPLKDLKVGDIIYTEVLIDVADLRDPQSQSRTTKKTQGGKAVKRICIVLEASGTSVQVTYTATFDESNELPTLLDKNMWYPIRPATKEGYLDPLPPIMTPIKAGWASLRRMHTITKSKVDVLRAGPVPLETVALIRGRMQYAGYY